MRADVRDGLDGWLSAVAQFINIQAVGWFFFAFGG